MDILWKDVKICRECHIKKHKKLDYLRPGHRICKMCHECNKDRPIHRPRFPPRRYIKIPNVGRIPINLDVRVSEER